MYVNNLSYNNIQYFHLLYKYNKKYFKLLFI